MNKKIHLVLGMHRSFTSALSKFLSDIGICLGEFYNVTNEYENVYGYYENFLIGELNEKILNSLNFSWDTISFSQQNLKDKNLDEFYEEAKELIINQFDKNDEIVIKDPRMCLLLPFWIDVIKKYDLGDTYFYYIFRNPSEVIMSQYKRYEHTKSVHLSGKYLDYVEKVWLEYNYNVIVNLSKEESSSILVIDGNEHIKDENITLDKVRNFLKRDDLEIKDKSVDMDQVRNSNINLELQKSTVDFYGDILKLSEKEVINNDDFCSICKKYDYLESFMDYGHSYDKYLLDQKIDITNLNKQINDMVVELAEKNDLLKVKDSEVFEKISQLDLANNEIVAKNIELENINEQLKKQQETIDLQKFNLSNNENVLINVVERGHLLEMELNNIRSSKTYIITTKIKNKFRGNIFARRMYSLLTKMEARLAKEYSIYKISRSEFFDKKYYKSNNSDLKNVKNYARHFYEIGGFEGRNPSKLFDINFYSASNHDVLLGNINPLYHYIKYGKNEGRKIKAVNETLDEAIDIRTTSATDLFENNKIAIIGDLNLPQCRKYRVEQKMEIIKSAGYECDISHYLDVIRAISIMQTSSIVIFYRVQNDDVFKKYLNEIKRLGIREVFYDIDDPIFSREILETNSSLDTLSKVEQVSILNSTTKYKEAMEQVGKLILSTRKLGEKAGSILNMDYFIWENYIDEELLDNLEQALENSIDINYDAVVISYMSGSRAHDYDFNEVKTDLLKIMKKYSNTKLLVGGFVKLDDEFDEFKKKGRIIAFDFGGYDTYIANLRNADINLVPLEINDFNECKSAIRYFEASLCKIPSVCTDVGQFSDCIDDGINGMLIKGNKGWFESIEKLIVDENYRKKLGNCSYENTVNNHCVDTLDKNALCNNILG